MKFRKKPVVIEAVQLFDGISHSILPAWLLDAADDGRVTLFHNGADVHTLEGSMRASPGDWIIRGIKGELYPCKADIFAATYEPAG